MTEKIKKILAYLIPIFGGLGVFFLTKKEETDTKFQAVQGILFWVVVAVVEVICGIIPFIGGILKGLFGLILFVILVSIILKVVKEQEVKLPVLSDITKSILKNV